MSRDEQADYHSIIKTEVTNEVRRHLMQKEEQLREQPIIRTTVRKSEDGKYVVTKTEITYIKPIAFYNALLKSASEDEE